MHPGRGVRLRFVGDLGKCATRNWVAAASASLPMVRASAIGKAFGLAAATRMFSSSCGVLKDHERLRCHAEGWAEKSAEPPAGSTVKKKGFSRMNPAGNSRSSQDLRGPPGERTNRLEQGGQFVTNPGPVTAVCKGS